MNHSRAPVGQNNPTLDLHKQAAERDKAIRDAEAAIQRDLSPLADIVVEVAERVNHYNSVEGLAEISEKTKIPLDTIVKHRVFLIQELRNIYGLVLNSVEMYGSPKVKKLFEETIEEYKKNESERTTDS